MLKTHNLMSKIITLELFISGMRDRFVSPKPLTPIPDVLPYPFVTTNGCFDILHAGHVTCLERAASFGSQMLVLVNSDDSVKRLKGEGRPFVKLEQRMMVLAALESVNYVVSFDEDTPEAALKQLYLNGVGPSVHVKGGDYKVPEYLPDTPGLTCSKIKEHYSDFPEAMIVQVYGGQVKVIPFEHDISTSEIVSRIRTNRYLRKEFSDKDAATSQGR